MQSVARCLAWVLVAFDIGLHFFLEQRSDVSFSDVALRSARKLFVLLEFILMPRLRTSRLRHENDGFSSPSDEQAEPMRQRLKMDCGRTLPPRLVIMEIIRVTFGGLMHKAHSMLSLEVHKATVCVWFEIEHEPITGPNIANVDVLFVRILGPPEVLDRFNHWSVAEP